MTRDEFASEMIPTAVRAGRLAARRRRPHMADEGESIAYVALAEATAALEAIHPAGPECHEGTRKFVRKWVFNSVWTFLDRGDEHARSAARLGHRTNLPRGFASGARRFDAADPRDDLAAADSEDVFRHLTRPATSPPPGRRRNCDVFAEGLDLVRLRFRDDLSMVAAGRSRGLSYAETTHRYYPALAVVRERALTLAMTEGGNY